MAETAVTPARRPLQQFLAAAPPCWGDVEIRIRTLVAAHHQRNQAVATSLKRRASSGEYTVGDVGQIKNLQLHGVDKIANIEVTPMCTFPTVG